MTKPNTVYIDIPAEAPAHVEPDSTQSQINDLAALSPIGYDQVRIEKAKALNVRPGTLDKEVAKARGDIAEQSANDVVEELAPWESPVDGNALLNEIAQTINRYVVLPKGATTALALWALGSFCMDSWRVWPKLLITSPEKRCGKSTLLETIEGVVYRSLLTSNISPSAIFRCIEEWAPTLLIDEADTFTKDNDELNGVINAGHTKRTAGVIRSEKVGDSFKPRKFSVWCPQVIAGIGEQRGTLHDRSINIELRRKLPDEQRDKLPGNYYESMNSIRRRCLRWAVDNQEALTQSTVQVPGCGNDRAMDNWQPLFEMAQVVGGAWPDKVRGAYTIFTESHMDNSEDAGHMLIEDIGGIISGWPYGVIFSSVLVDKLVAMEDRPWFEWKRGKPLTQNSLAKLLKPYQLTATSKRIGSNTAKGYDVGKMETAFLPYLSNTHLSKCHNVTSQAGQGFQANSKRHKTESVTLSNSPKALQDKGCDGVTLQTPPTGTYSEKTTDNDIPQEVF